MFMRLENFSSTLQITNILTKNESVTQKTLQQVATGMKINNAGDNSSAYAISERLRTKIHSLAQANQNIKNDNALLNSALGGSVNIVEKIRSLKALAMNAANDSATDEDRRIIQREINQIISSIDDDTTISFNGKKLIDGSATHKTELTASVLLNSALDKNTTGNTALTALKNSNGASLGIVSSDTVTASYVYSGKTYTTNFRVGINTVENIFRKLNRIDKSVFGGVEEEAEEESTQPLDTLTNQIRRLNLRAPLATAANGLEEEEIPEPTPPSDEYFRDKVLSVLVNLISFCLDYYETMNSNGSLDFVLGDLVDEMLEKQSDGSYKDVSDWTKTNAWQNLSDEAKSFINSKSYRISNAFENAGYSDALRTFNETNEQYLQDLEDYNDYLTEMSTELVKSSAQGLSVTARQKGIEGQITAITLSISDKAGNLKREATNALNSFKTVTFASDSSEENSLNFQIGDKTEQFINMSLNDFRATTLGLKSFDGNFISVSNKKAAQVAMVVFENTLQKILEQTTDIGTIEQRLGYTAENISTMQENLQASDSVIRDAELSQSINDFAKNKVLTHLAQKMLIQANKNSGAMLNFLR